MATIDDQIKANNTKIENNSTRISQLKASGNDWIKDAADDTCKGTTKQKNACTAEKARKNAYGQGMLDEAKVLESMNVSLLADVKELVKLREAEGKAIVSLAGQGKTTASVLAQAEGDAKAAVDSANKIADAQASVIKTTAAADNNSKLAITMTIVVVVVIITILVVRKFKKTKA